MSNIEILNGLNRETVKSDYDSAKNKNLEQFILGNNKSNSEYIYYNQKNDANQIIEKFYTTNVRAISIIKRTKVGMDGLMIELAYKISTHIDDNFMIHRNNIFIITAMSNLAWEEDMRDKIPNCFRDNIYHHGKLQKLKERLIGIKNALIINDEIDTGDKEDQKLHKILKESGILNINYMKENNIKFVFVSATMINELKELYKWGDSHYCYKMTIPNNYISHGDFLELGIIKEFYKIETEDEAIEWIENDIIDNYKNDFRVHFIRTDIENNQIIKNACDKLNIKFFNHTSTNRISYEELTNIFNNLDNHIVIAVKGFYRRANLIPNDWKLKIGAMHERYCKNFDTNVQIQGLVGRMTGYWKNIINNGHKTGPFRTSIDAITQYENFYETPLTNDKYSSNRNANLFLQPKNFGINEPQNIKLENINKHVPIIIDLNIYDDDISTQIYYITSLHDKINYVKSIICNDEKYKKLLAFISNPTVKCYGFITPKNTYSYKIHITDLIKASNKKMPYSINLNSEYKKYNNWQCFIDNKNNYLCILIWTIDNNIY